MLVALYHISKLITRMLHSTIEIISIVVKNAFKKGTPDATTADITPTAEMFQLWFRMHLKMNICCNHYSYNMHY